MTNTEKRLEKVDWREIDFAIMYFQVHVRKVTGGNDFGFVDSTDLKSAIKQALLQTQKETAKDMSEELKKYGVTDVYTGIKYVPEVMLDVVSKVISNNLKRRLYSIDEPLTDNKE